MSANLLFIYGPSGVGKTGLLRMMAETLHGVQDILRVGSEQIVNEMTLSMQHRKYADFFNSYAVIENLLIDNLWILRSLPAAAKEMGRLIEARMAHGNLTVLASDLLQQDVMQSLPAMGNCLKHERVVCLNIGSTASRRGISMEVAHE